MNYTKKKKRNVIYYCSRNTEKVYGSYVHKKQNRQQQFFVGFSFKAVFAHTCLLRGGDSMTVYIHPVAQAGGGAKYRQVADEIDMLLH